MIFFKKKQFITFYISLFSFSFLILLDKIKIIYINRIWIIINLKFFSKFYSTISNLFTLEMMIINFF